LDNKWKDESIKFDDLYSESSWESRIPYFGTMVRRRLAEREMKALEFAGSMGGKTILDLGCGVGRFSLKAASMGAQVHAYDISNAAIAVAREQAKAAGLEERCSFYVVDLLDIDFPPADIWYDLGCLQYIPDIAPILRKLTDCRRFFSALPRRGHWLNVPRLIYRNLLKGNPYRTYSEKEIREVFAVCGDVNIEPVGLTFNITSKA
jgi:SAM-dependent methyltransferase